MNFQSHRSKAHLVASILSVSLALGAPAPSASAQDPRVGLKGGLRDAGQAVWNLRVVSNTPPSGKFADAWNSDMAFKGNYVIQGNYNGYQIWDISNPAKPTLRLSNYCPASQSDVSVFRNLLFVSAEGATGRIDCSDQGVKETTSPARIRGVRIFDITDIEHPKNIANVQTCRGSHTHTVLVDPKDPDNVYVYVSGSSAVRPDEELHGCSDAAPDKDPNSAHFRIEVIKVPLAHPERAAIVTSPRIFDNLAAVQTHGETAGQPKAPSDDDKHTGPDQCHDITVYPAIGYAGGACGGYGLLLDIRDPAHPVRIDAAADTNFSYWHSATFNNDGTKVLFSDEWGGGGAPKCRATDPMEWGADALFTIENRKLHFKGYYKMPAAQTVNENCVAHNGSLIPIPGRDVMVQSWYQGGISVFDWTDAAHAKEIAFHDRGPVDSTRFVVSGSWSVYWYNGYMVSSEMARGLDIFELTPSQYISQNEIDAAKTVHYDYLNTQGQPKMVWPPSFSLARAYIDQLERSNSLKGGEIAGLRKSLDAAEQSTGAKRSSALTKLAKDVDGDVNESSDAAKTRMLANAVRELAAVR